MDHKVLKARIFRLDRLDAGNHLSRGSTKPSLLRNAVLQQRRAGWRARRAPDATLLVCIAHKAERREPFKALVMRRLEPADRLFTAVGQIDAGAPDHVLAELLILASLETGCVVSANHVIQNFLAVKSYHCLQTILRHELYGFAACNRHPNLDR